MFLQSQNLQVNDIYAILLWDVSDVNHPSSSPQAHALPLGPRKDEQRAKTLYQDMLLCIITHLV